MKKFISGITIGIIITSGSLVYAAQNILSDIEEGSWYEDSVTKWYSTGIIKGYEDSTFRPENYINRAELSVILDRYDDYLSKKFDAIRSSLTLNNLSFEYPVTFSISNINSESGFVAISNSTIKIIFDKGERPFGFETEENSPISAALIDITIKEGSLITTLFDADHNELTFKDGNKFLFFGIDPESGEGEYYTVWAYYKTDEERAKVLEILSTVSLK